MKNCLVMVLAGGQGTRLMPLTRDRAKPAVPFGGRYRIIDFVLSNFVNSRFYRIKLLTQYKSQSLNSHVARAWRLSRMLDHYVEPVPAQQRTGLDWYRGSADAVYQNLNLLDDEKPADVAIFGGDHIYKMDVSQMFAVHLQTQAHATIAAIRVPIGEASAFGVMHVDAEGRVISFDEKPANPAPMPGNPDYALVSMGNYFFRSDILKRLVTEDASCPNSTHDFGRDVIPKAIAEGLRVQMYDFSTNVVPGESPERTGYWRDVGTVTNYFDASMDLVAIDPEINLHNRSWPIRTDHSNDPPAKFVHDRDERVGRATESLVCDGCIISGGRIARCVLGPRVRVNSWSRVEESVLLDRVNVGRHVRLRRTIVDKDVVIPEGMEIGFDHALDRERGLTVTRDGIVVVPKGTVFLD